MKNIEKNLKYIKEVKTDTDKLKLYRISKEDERGKD